MKVVHVLCSNQFSGAENVVCQIIHMFREDKNFKFVYCSPKGSIQKSLDERDIDYYLLNEFTLKNLKKMLKDVKPDLIHAHDMRAGFYCSLVCRNIPLVLHVHNNNYDSRNLSLKSFLFYFAAKKAKKIFWVSKSCFNGYYFNQKLTKKSTILYNVIDKDELFNKSNIASKKERFDIIYLGRLTEQKNPERLISVLNKITENNPLIKIAIVGTGDLEEIVKNMIWEYKLNSNIRLFGFLNNPYGILGNSKMMLMTSRWEGTPMCALEAMCLGIPIVSTPTDGLKDLIINGETGYLSDDNDVLVDRCSEIINNEELRRYLSQNTIQRANQILDSEQYKNTLKSIYCKI